MPRSDSASGLRAIEAAGQAETGPVDPGYGRRFGELVAVGVGTGVCKTTFIAQQAADDLPQGEPVAVFAFEASPTEIVKRTAGVTVGQQFHIPGEGWHLRTWKVRYRPLNMDQRSTFTTTSVLAIGTS